ncbi:MAG: enoyl-CoA hydratase/isomerase family protein, partial [Alphaproteobacteria bacterium]
MTDAPEILHEVADGLALVTLNRPAALNALTLGMVRALDPLLAGYAADPDIRAVAVRGAGEKGFCAGGDIRALHDSRARGDSLAADFFREEYRLDRRIFTFPKPYIALMDGIVMGGGVGVSVHGGFRIVCEATVFAMPETGIGMFPDVGGAYFLPRLPGGIGMFLAMTGARLRAADCLQAGIGDAFVPLSRQAELLDRLRAGAAPQEAIAALSADPGPAPL